MQLKPLEFSDCLSDSPFFRQSLHQHEIGLLFLIFSLYIIKTNKSLALEQTSKKIKEVEQNCRKILSYTNS